MKALFVWCALVLAKTDSGDTCCGGAGEQETLTQRSFKWPAIDAREHPQIRSTFCFPAQNAGRTGTTVRYRSSLSNSLYSSDHFIISGSQVVTFRRWPIQNSPLSYALRMKTMWTTGCPRG